MFTTTTSAKPPLLIAIGIALVAVALVIAWYSSTVTMRLTRSATAAVGVTIDEWMFGLVPVGSHRIDGVRSASLIRGRTVGSRSHTPDQLVFLTASGPVDHGYAQQRFMRDFVEIDAFLKDSTRIEASLSSLDRGREAVRFAAAQLGVLFLALVGAGLAGFGVRELKRRDAEIGV